MERTTSLYPGSLCTPLSINPQTIENELDNYPYSEDDINLIEKYETGFFIQDKMMYRPFKIFPPSRSRITYACQLDAWLRQKLHGEFTEMDRNFIMRCLEME